MLAVGVVIGLLVGGGVMWYAAPGNSPNAGPKRMPPPCVLAMREDFYAFLNANEKAGPFDQVGYHGPLQDAWNAHSDDAWACQQSFPDEDFLNRTTYGDSGSQP